MQRPQSGTLNYSRRDFIILSMVFIRFMKILILFCDNFNFECDREVIRPEMPTSKEKEWLFRRLVIAPKKGG